MWAEGEGVAFSGTSFSSDAGSNSRDGDKEQYEE
jgi:hypothetical protein